MRDFKTDFRLYYSDLMNSDNITTVMKLGGINNFYNMPASMQWGVKVDFFDSEKICIEDYSYIQGYKMFINGHSNGDYFKTRSESREKALEKAIEIYEQLEPKPINLD